MDDSGLSDDETSGEVTFFCVEELGLSDELGEEIISFPKLEISKSGSSLEGRPSPWPLGLEIISFAKLEISLSSPSSTEVAVTPTVTLDGEVVVPCRASADASWMLIGTSVPGSDEDGCGHELLQYPHSPN